MQFRNNNFITNPVFDDRDFGDTHSDIANGRGFDDQRDVVNHEFKDLRAEQMAQAAPELRRKIGRHALEGAIPDYDESTRTLRLAPKGVGKHLPDEYTERESSQ